MNSKPHVVIIGAGFGGLEAAKKLSGEDVRVTVIDRTNYHLFQPLLYQVATAALSPADIAAPVRAILSKGENMEVILAEVEAIDVGSKKVKMTDRELDYDYLIVATGARALIILAHVAVRKVVDMLAARILRPIDHAAEDL